MNFIKKKLSVKNSQLQHWCRLADYHDRYHIHMQVFSDTSCGVFLYSLPDETLLNDIARFALTEFPPGAHMEIQKDSMIFSPSIMQIRDYHLYVKSFDILIWISVSSQWKIMKTDKRLNHGETYSQCSVQAKLKPVVLKYVGVQCLDLSLNCCCPQSVFFFFCFLIFNQTEKVIFFQKES